MSEPRNPTDRVIRVISEYVEPGEHLLTMERIHEDYFGDKQEFTSWSDVYDWYSEHTWSASEAREFVELAKQIVEGDENIPETYFVIDQPKDASAETLIERLEERKYDPDAEAEEREGFDVELVDGRIEGRYVYVDVSTEVSYSGGVRDYVQEGGIEFRIYPDQNLLVLESTKVTDVQKSKSYFGDRDIDIIPCRDLTNIPDQAVDRINSFIDSFSDDASEPGPTILSIDNVSMHNPVYSDVDEEENPDEEMLTKLNFEGRNIRNHPDVESHLEDGWIIKGFHSTVNYKNSQYTMKMSGNSVMGYAKIEDVSNFEHGGNLIEDIRGKYMEHIY